MVPAKDKDGGKHELAEPAQMAMLALHNLPFHILPCSAAQNETRETELFPVALGTFKEVSKFLSVPSLLFSILFCSLFYYYCITVNHFWGVNLIIYYLYTLFMLIFLTLITGRITNFGLILDLIPTVLKDSKRGKKKKEACVSSIYLPGNWNFISELESHCPARLVLNSRLHWNSGISPPEKLRFLAPATLPNSECFLPTSFCLLKYLYNCLTFVSAWWKFALQHLRCIHFRNRVVTIYLF